MLQFFNLSFLRSHGFIPSIAYLSFSRQTNFFFLFKTIPFFDIYGYAEQQHNNHTIEWKYKIIFKNRNRSHCGNHRNALPDHWLFRRGYSYLKHAFHKEKYRNSKNRDSINNQNIEQSIMNFCKNCIRNFCNKIGSNSRKRFFIECRQKLSP